MNREELVYELALPLNKMRINQFILQDLCDASDLIELSTHYDSQIAFHAAWILEYLIYDNPERFKGNYERFVSVFEIQSNRSCQRHFTKILMLLTESSNIHILKDINLFTIVETSFALMIDSETPVAITVNCMDILYNLRHLDSWIAEELRLQVIYLLKDGTAAVQSRGKRVLKKLKNIENN